MTGIFSSTHEKTLDACYSINLNSHLVPIISMTRNIRFRKRSKPVIFGYHFVWQIFDLIQDWDSHTHHVRNIHIKTKLKHLLILPGDERSMAKELFNLGNFRAGTGHFGVILGSKFDRQMKNWTWKDVDVKKRNSKYFSNYTKRQCFLDCFLAYTEIKCSCRAFYFPLPVNRSDGKFTL